jgi:hypothetical protein
MGLWMFKFAAFFTLFLFMGMLLFVSLSAYARKSGNIKLDMGKIHMMLRQNK